MFVGCLLRCATFDSVAIYSIPIGYIGGPFSIVQKMARMVIQKGAIISPNWFQNKLQINPKWKPEMEQLSTKNFLECSWADIWRPLVLLVAPLAYPAASGGASKGASEGASGGSRWSAWLSGSHFLWYGLLSIRHLSFTFYVSLSSRLFVDKYLSHSAIQFPQGSPMCFLGIAQF